MVSIQAKLFALTSGLTVVVVGFLATYFPGRELASARRTLDDKAGTYARLVSRQVEPGVAFDDRETVREVFAAVAQDPDVRSMTLYKSTGARLFAMGEPSDAAPPSAPPLELLLENARGVVRTWSPVVSREGPAGTLVLELTTSRLDDEAAQIQRVAAVAGLLALAFGMLAAWGIGRPLARRLQRIAAATHAVANGDLTVEPVSDVSRDEIGQLARSFAVMVAHLRELVARIREASERDKDRLDALVRTRTGELEASVDRYKTLVESTNAVPWELAPAALRFAYVSPQAGRILGKDPQAIVGSEDLSGFVHQDDLARVTAELARLAQSAEPADIEVEHRVVSALGRVTDVRSIVRTTGAAGGVAPRLRGITLDVTRQRKLECELRQAQKLECVGRLAAGVAHEINTPVQFVSDSIHFVCDAAHDLFALTEQLVRVQRSVLEEAPAAATAAALAAVGAIESADLEYLVENVPRALARALEGLGRVTTIVRSMKEFAHPGEREMSVVDLNQAIESTLVIASNEYKYVADLETTFGTLPGVQCHAGDVNQVVLNIVVNAAHAIADVVTGTEHRGRIWLRTAQEGDDVVIAIGDSGPGIPAHVRDRIFDPFFTTKEVGRGTGQGLAIARSIVVEKHRGQLTFETEVGRGTTFFIRLPILAAPEGQVAA